MRLEKINLLEISSSLGFGGTERALLNVCRYVNRKYFNVFACGFSEGGYREAKLKELGVEYIVANNSVDTVIDFINNKQINAVDFHRSGQFNELEDRIIRKAKSENPNIVFLENNIFGKYDQASIGYLDGSIFQSMMHVHERYLRESRQSFDFDREKVFYNMIDAEAFEKFRLSEAEILKYKTELGIKKNDFIIGKIARSHIAKWSDLILDMMPYAIKLVPNLKFIIIGLPESRRQVVKKGVYRNNVIILDETTDEAAIHRFYQTIDVLAHSSKIGECNGNTINEAMFWKKPTIVNSTPNKDNGQLEQVEHMVNGIVANSPQNYARAVAYLAQNPEIRIKMGEKCFRKATTEYNPTQIAGMLEKYIVEKLVSKGLGLSDEAVEHYKKINYSPSEKQIANYKNEYPERLKLDFGKLSFSEKVVNLLKSPQKFIQKFKDSLEGRYGFRMY